MHTFIHSCQVFMFSMQASVLQFKAVLSMYYFLKALFLYNLDSRYLSITKFWKLSRPISQEEQIKKSSCA